MDLMKCERCGKEMPRMNRKQKVCPECRKIIKQERSKEYWHAHKHELKKRQRYCRYCGKVMENYEPKQKICEECYSAIYGSFKTASDSRKKLLRTNRESIIAFNEEARERHMSYGQLQAMMRSEANRA